MGDPHYGFWQRLRLAFRWNATWPMFRGAAADGLLELAECLVTLVAAAVSVPVVLARLVFLPVWLLVVQPVSCAVRYRGAGYDGVWRTARGAVEKGGCDESQGR